MQGLAMLRSMIQNDNSDDSVQAGLTGGQTEGRETRGEGS